MTDTDQATKEKFMKECLKIWNAIQTANAIETRWGYFIYNDLATTVSPGDIYLEDYGDQFLLFSLEALTIAREEETNLDKLNWIDANIELATEDRANKATAQNIIDSYKTLVEAHKETFNYLDQVYVRDRKSDLEKISGIGFVEKQLKDLMLKSSYDHRTAEIAYALSARPIGTGNQENKGDPE